MNAKGNIAIKMRSQLDDALRQARLEEIANHSLQSSFYGGFGNFTIDNLDHLEEPFILKAKWYSPQALTMGNNVFLILAKGPQYVAIDSVRSLIFEKNIEYPITVDSASYYWHDIIVVPSAYHFQLLPHVVQISNSAGNYSSEYHVLTPSKIEVVRQLSFRKNCYLPQDYAELKSIASTVARDTTHIFYLKKEKKGDS